MKHTDTGIDAAICYALAVRALESTRSKPRIYDKEALLAAHYLNLDLQRIHNSMRYERTLSKTLLFDRALESLLLQYPDAICINLGCMLDSRFHRIDNGQITWYDIDSPGNLHIHSQAFSQHDRAYAVPISSDSHTWLRSIPKSKPVIVIVEHSFEHLHSERIATILNLLANHFSRGALVTGVDKCKPGRTTKQGKSPAPRDRTLNAEEFCALDTRFTLVRELKPAEALQRSGIAKLRASFDEHVGIFTWG